MATNHTEHYNLSQWVKTDLVKMDDFNEDNLKIDAALGAKTEILVGTYTGDGESSQTIELGCQPKAVYVCKSNGCAVTEYGDEYSYGGLAFPGHSAPSVSITESGFSVIYFVSGRIHRESNKAGQLYHYIAFV